ncbi:MAG: site-specific DNA-methyltransferase [Deltaproteobacteria bacterium]|nr:site-specific DNA-methyltransferase [Deltaproteobacteria bacterium]
MQMILGDCLEKMQDIKTCSVDLTVTSPPYDNLRTYNGNNSQWGAGVWELALEYLYRITKEGGVVVWVVGDATIKGSETGTSFRQALHAMECGFRLHDTMIWAKNSVAFPDANRYQQTFEYMFVFAKGKPASFNMIRDRENKSFGQRVAGTTCDNRGIKKLKYKASCHGKKINRFGSRWNIWVISTNKGKKNKHPATLPEQIANDHIISWSNKGDLVLDPFMGAGTTGKMAKVLGRDFIGIEIDESYYNIATKRIDAAIFNERQ